MRRIIGRADSGALDPGNGNQTGLRSRGSVTTAPRTRSLSRLALLPLLALLLYVPPAAAATSFTFECADPSGPPVTSCSVHLNPDFHNGNPGTVLWSSSSAGKHTISVPAGAHKVVVIAKARTSAGTNTSVMVTATEPGTACQPGWAPLGYQSWWLDPTGEAEPGRHAHINGLCWPVNNLIVRGTHTFRFEVELHAQPPGAALTRVRLKDYPGGTDRWVAAKPLPQPVNGNLKAQFSATINTDSLSAGRHEFRWGVYVTQPNGVVQLLSSRSEVCIRSCSPAYRSGTWQGNGSWYKNDTIGYVDARVHSAIPVSGTVPSPTPTPVPTAIPTLAPTPTPTPSVVITPPPPTATPTLMPTPPAGC
jgi:hypothetical protein